MDEYNKNNTQTPAKLENEFTLNDTYDYLKDIQEEMHEKMEELVINIDNINDDEAQMLMSNLAITPNYIQKQEQRLAQGLLKYNHGYDVRIDPISNTIDMYKTAIWELEQEVNSIVKMSDRLKAGILNVKSNICCLENEKKGLERMKETCTDAIVKSTTTGIINDEEVVDSKKLFSTVKSDLALIVNTIFPNHSEFQEILGELTRAYMTSGGDQAYIDIAPKYIECVKFMVEADIATYHRNDKNKVRLVDLL